MVGKHTLKAHGDLLNPVNTGTLTKIFQHFEILDSIFSNDVLADRKSVV